MKIIAVIPCHNEARTIGGVVETALRYVDTVVVVDNKSTDLTSEIAKMSGAKVIEANEKKGAGYATNLGLRYFYGSVAEYAVILDGDGQHNPDDIPLLLRPVIKDEVDFTVGTRHHGWRNVPLYRRFGIGVINWLYNFGRYNKLHDTQCCFRAMNWKALKTIYPLKETGFGFSIEMLAKAQRNGIRMREVAIDCIYHENTEQNSTLNPIRHGVGVALKTIKWRFK